MRFQLAPPKKPKNIINILDYIPEDMAEEILYQFKTMDEKLNYVEVRFLKTTSFYVAIIHTDKSHYAIYGNLENLDSQIVKSWGITIPTEIADGLIPAIESLILLSGIENPKEYEVLAMDLCVIRSGYNDYVLKANVGGSN